MTKPLLSINDLRISYLMNGQSIHALRGVSLAIYDQQSVAIVGESGSGKSQLFQAVMGLLPLSAQVKGEIFFKGQLLSKDSNFTTLRGQEISLIMQNAMTALNPYLKIGLQLTEVLEFHQQLRRSEATKQVVIMLEKVQLKQAHKYLQRYPHELSGGMQQRVLIAMALLCRPKILIADEPTTALDVRTQHEIVTLLAKTHQQENNTLVFITHDLSLVKKLCQQVVVMYAGQIVEQGRVDDILSNAQHPYTQALLQAAFLQNQDRNKPLMSIDGAPPSSSSQVSGCAYAPRCSQVIAQCYSRVPLLKTNSQSSSVACFVNQDCNNDGV